MIQRACPCNSIATLVTGIIGQNRPRPDTLVCFAKLFHARDQDIAGTSISGSKAQPQPANYEQPHTPDREAVFFARKRARFSRNERCPSPKTLVPQAMLRLGISRIFLGCFGRKSTSARMNRNTILSQAIAFQ
jgi:hypothetical protein